MSSDHHKVLLSVNVTRDCNGCLSSHYGWSVTFDPDTSAKITSYRPRSAPPGWEAVADQVRATVAASAPWVGYRIERLLHMVGRLAIWCHGRGLPADPEVWLRHETIDAFVLAGCADLAPRTAQTYRSWLRQVRAALAWAQRGESTPVALSAPSERTAPTHRPNWPGCAGGPPTFAARPAAMPSR